MIYPTHATLINEESAAYIPFLESIGIKHDDRMLSSPDDLYLIVDGANQVWYTAKTCNLELLVAPSDFRNKYKNFHDTLLSYVYSLKEGDIVTIEPRRIGSECYPFSFTSEMNRWAGENLRIARVVTDSGYDYKRYRFNNTTNRKFYLNDGQFHWHSSMFVLPNLTPVKRLELSSLSIDIEMLNSSINIEKLPISNRTDCFELEFQANPFF